MPQINGSGNLTITDVASGVDLSSLSVDNALNVTLEVTESREITDLDSSWIDNLDLAADTVVTMTVKQYNDIERSGEGSYALADTAEELATVTDSIMGIDITVTDAVSLAQLQALDTANGADGLTYFTVSDTSEELVANANGEDDVTYILNDVDVVVTDNITITELGDVKTAIGGGTVTAQTIEGSIAELMPEEVVIPYVGEGTNVTVTGSVTIDQIKAIDEQNGDGELTYVLTDSYSEIADDLADDSFDYLSDATAIQLSDYTLGERTVADIQALLALDNMEYVSGDDLSYTLKDTAANLASSSDDMDSILAQATSITASTDASVSQAKTIYARDNAATYNISDSASSLANGDSAAAVTQAGDLTATTTATAAQATTIAERDGSVGTLTYNVADTYENLTNSANSAGMVSATDVTVNWGGSYLTTSQAGEIVDFTNGGLTTIPYIRDNAANINGFVSGNGEDENLRYDFYVEDSAANIITQIGDASAANLYFATGNATSDVAGDQSVSQIYVDGTFDVADAKTFWEAINPVFDNNIETTAGKTYYRIYDAIGSYDDETVAQDWITKSDQLGVSGSAADIYAAQNGSTAGFDDVFALMNSRGSDYINVTGSVGSQTIQGAPGSDYISVGDDNDWVDGNAGNDTILGGGGIDNLYGGDGRDVIYADTVGADTDFATYRYSGTNQITGGNDGDRLYGSDHLDNFIFAGGSREALVAESGTSAGTRDYIENFTFGDTIQFTNADSVQFVSGGSTSAAAVEAGTLGLAIRYEKNISTQDWDQSSMTTGTRVLVDIADESGHFDNVADMQIILVGSNIDLNQVGNTLVFGG